MRFLRPFAILFTGYLLVTLPLQGQAPATDTISTGLFAITHVYLIPMKGEELLPDQTVIVDGGVITKVGPAEKTAVPKGAKVIEGKGMYLMPGLSEMHAHIPVAENGNDSLVKETLFLYLANGVTTIRGMLGAPYHLQLKKQVATGEILGPRIYTASPSLNGQTVQTMEEARNKVARYKTEGYDFLKIHPGLTIENFDEIVKTARRVNIPFSGHVPTQVGIAHAIASGYASIDHMDGYLEGLVPASDKTNPDAGGFFGFNYTELANTNLIPQLASKTKAAKTWVVPTESLLERWTSSRSADEFLAEPAMQYMPPATRYQWRLSKQTFSAAPEYSVDRAAKFVTLRQKILRGLNRSKVGLLLGSDSPQVLNVPGFSIHQEMQAMAKAGIPALVILKSGTVNPSIFFDEVGKYGVVQKGASADLVLMRANPLENVANAQQIAGVMVRGSWLPKAYIDAQLAAIAVKYQ